MSAIDGAANRECEHRAACAAHHELRYFATLRPSGPRAAPTVRNVPGTRSELYRSERSVTPANLALHFTTCFTTGKSFK